MYASTLQAFIQGYNLSLLGYADDHSVYSCFDPKDEQDIKSTIDNMQLCLVRINEWMNLNRLKMNTSKTEFIILGSRVHLSNCDVQSLTVCNDLVKRNDSIKYLGVRIDEQLSLKDHIPVISVGWLLLVYITSDKYVVTFLRIRVISFCARFSSRILTMLFHCSMDYLHLLLCLCRD